MRSNEHSCRGREASQAAVVLSLLVAVPALALLPPACAVGESSGNGGGTTTPSWTTTSSGGGGSGGQGNTGGSGNNGGTGAEGGTGGSGNDGGSGGSGNDGGTGGSGNNGGSGGAGNNGGSGGSGADGGTGGTGGSGGGPVAYSHTINLNDQGANDFVVADERFDSSSMDGNPDPPDNSYYGFVSWDATYLYLGMQGPDVGSGIGTRLWLIYLSGSPGWTTGFTYSAQTPTLPFDARWHIHWAAANNNTVAYVYNANSWQDASWNFAGDVYQNGTYVEMRIPRADIGNPTTVKVHMNMVNTLGSPEWSYGAVPSNSFVDGADPNYTHYFEFDLTDSLAPTDYSPLP